MFHPRTSRSILFPIHDFNQLCSVAKNKNKCQDCYLAISRWIYGSTRLRDYAFLHIFVFGFVVSFSTVALKDYNVVPAFTKHTDPRFTELLRSAGSFRKLGVGNNSILPTLRVEKCSHAIFVINFRNLFVVRSCLTPKKWSLKQLP